MKLSGKNIFIGSITVWVLMFAFILFQIRAAVHQKNTTDTVLNVTTFYSGIRKITCQRKNDTVFLRDLSKGDGIVTLHGEHNSYNEVYQGKLPDWKLTGKDQFALDVHFGVSRTYLFYKTLFNRNSVDDHGMAIYSYVNDPVMKNNAEWTGSSLRFGLLQNGNSCSSIDIIGHELTHGVIHYSCLLHFGGESGAINESICDIMGKSIEFWTDGNIGNWKIGHKMDRDIRDLSNPKLFQQPDTYKDSVFWYRGLNEEISDHKNSGVGNYMFYLLVNGGSGVNTNGLLYHVKGIGLGAADSVIYYCLTKYLNSDSNYVGWRTGCIKTATALYGASAKKTKSVIKAWDAVGVR